MESKTFEFNGGYAKIVAGSECALTGTRLTTFEVSFPRIILAEVNTHKMLSKNGASSRAIPLVKAMEYVNSRPFIPSYVGMNQPGMQAAKSVDEETLGKFLILWNEHRDTTLEFVKKFDDLKIHKQIAARPLETHSFMKMVISGTEWNNFFALRDHPAAQPEFRDLARAMKLAQEDYEDKYAVLKLGSWHTPYYEDGVWEPDLDPERYAGVSPHLGKDYVVDFYGNSLEDALKISASCCAQTSYRTANASLEKAEDIISKLFDTCPVHASPAEHQGTPIGSVEPKFEWPLGVTHVDRGGKYWSANFKEFVQYRQLIPNHFVAG